jgi:hypothetical protein
MARAQWGQPRQPVTGRGWGRGQEAQRMPMHQQASARAEPTKTPAKVLGPPKAWAKRKNSELLEETVLNHGLNYLGSDGRQGVARSKNLEQFRSFFGIGPKAVAAIWNCLASEPSTPQLDLRYLLATLNWLKTYSTEIVLSGWWRLHKETVSKQCWFYVELLHGLKDRRSAGENWKTIQSSSSLLTVRIVRPLKQERFRPPRFLLTQNTWTSLPLRARHSHFWESACMDCWTFSRFCPWHNYVLQWGWSRKLFEGTNSGGKVHDCRYWI